MSDGVAGSGGGVRPGRSLTPMKRREAGEVASLPVPLKI